MTGCRLALGVQECDSTQIVIGPSGLVLEPRALIGVPREQRSRHLVSLRNCAIGAHATGLALVCASSRSSLVRLSLRILTSATHFWLRLLCKNMENGRSSCWITGVVLHSRAIALLDVTKALHMMRCFADYLSTAYAMRSILHHGKSRYTIYTQK